MTHFVVHWSSYQGPSPHPDAQIIFSWFTNMTLMISLLWLNYSIHQRFSVAWRESPELFVFLHDLPPVFLSNQIISLFLLNISNSGLSWVTQPNLGSSHLFARRHSSLPRIPSLTLSGTSSPSFCITSVQFSSVQSLSHVQLFVIPCSMPGLPVHHQLPEFTQIHVRWVGDAISSSVVPFSSCLQSFPRRLLLIY